LKTKIHIEASIQDSPSAGLDEDLGGCLKKDKQLLS
jgi:hypothetical protein